MLEATTSRQECLSSTRAVRCDDEGRLEVVVTNTPSNSNKEEKEIIIKIAYTYSSSILSNILDILYLVLLIGLVYHIPSIIHWIDLVRKN